MLDLETYAQNLSRCWLPVAYAVHIDAEAPVDTMWLGVPLVFWRTSGGEPPAVHDVCIHRGTTLSLGWLEDDCLVCPYHGWRYDASGQCVEIPQTKSSRIPQKARTETFRCQERYGLIWVALGDPRYPLPEIPEFEDGSW